MGCPRLRATFIPHALGLWIGSGPAACSPAAGPSVAASEPEGPARDPREVACEGGEASACLALARAHERGEGGPVDLDAMAAYERRACEHGDAVACGLWGNTLAVGTPSTPADVPGALVQWRRGCEGGHGPSCFAVARAHRLGPAPPDEPVVVEFLAAACEHGQQQACDGARALPGVLHPAQVRATIREYVPRVQRCYNAALGQAPGTAGELELRLDVDGTGQVTAVEISRNTTGSTELAPCVVAAVAEIRFPAPRGNAPLVLNYPLRFTPEDPRSKQAEDPDATNGSRPPPPPQRVQPPPSPR